MKDKVFGSWDDADRWYGSLVGEKGHHYHQTVVLPNLLKLLGITAKSKGSLLDLGCGNGVFARHLPDSIEYVGIDAAKGLVQEARKWKQKGTFAVGDASQELPIDRSDFDFAVFVLSLQNMEHGDRAVQQAAKHLKPGGRLAIVLNHPAFRIPRQTDWGFDEGSKLQFRRVNCYMSAMKIPIATNPGKKDSPLTYSFHHPLSAIIHWIAASGCSVIGMEEWCSDKKSTGARAQAENRARREIPLFLALLAQKA